MYQFGENPYLNKVESCDIEYGISLCLSGSLISHQCFLDFGVELLPIFCFVFSNPPLYLLGFIYSSMLPGSGFLIHCLEHIVICRRVASMGAPQTWLGVEDARFLQFKDGLRGDMTSIFLTDHMITHVYVCL